MNNSSLFLLNNQLNELETKSRFLRLFIDVTNKCNLNCIMCAVHRNNNLRCDMPLDLFKKIALSTFIHTKELSLSCAYESFIIKDIIEMLDYIRDFEIPLSALVTNGTLLNEANISRLIYARLDCLFISIEGAQKTTYERIRKGADFEATLSKIKLINRLKEKSSSIKPEIYFMTTLMRSNIEELPNIIMLASKLKIKGVNLKLIDIYFPEIGCESLQNHKEDAVENVNQAKELAEKLRVKLFIAPELQSFLNVGKHFPAPKRDEIRRCREEQPVMYISSDGKVKPCPSWHGLPIGDFNSQDFWQIWGSDKFEKLRLGIESRNFSEECLECRYII